MPITESMTSGEQRNKTSYSVVISSQFSVVHVLPHHENWTLRCMLCVAANVFIHLAYDLFSSSVFFRTESELKGVSKQCLLSKHIDKFNSIATNCVNRRNKKKTTFVWNCRCKREGMINISIRKTTSRNRLKKQQHKQNTLLLFNMFLMETIVFFA